MNNNYQKSQEPQHVCFYSSKCDWSKAFITELSTTPFKKQFNFICVDPDKNGKRPNLPTWLKKVPTLVIKGDTEPIKTDAEVLNWLSLEKMKISSGSRNDLDGGSMSEPQAWMSAEMGSGVKNSYSGFNDDNEINHDHNYEQISTPSGAGTRTSSDISFGQQGKGEKKSHKEEAFDSQMEQFMKNRDNGMPQTRPRA